METNSIPNDALEGQKDRQELVHLHVAEYSSLMMRATYLDVFSGVAWTLLLTYLTFFVTAWSHIAAKSAFTWASAVAIELIFLVIQNCIGDHYIIVLYVERELRKLVGSEFHINAFWGYQRFLQNRRVLSAKVWELGIPVLALFGIGLAIWLRMADWTWSEDIAGLLTATIIFVVLVRCAFGLIRIRREWEAI
jgi:hypothetical protein